MKSKYEMIKECKFIIWWICYIIFFPCSLLVTVFPTGSYYKNYVIVNFSYSFYSMDACFYQWLWQPKDQSMWMQNSSMLFFVVAKLVLRLRKRTNRSRLGRYVFHTIQKKILHIIGLDFLVCVVSNWDQVQENSIYISDICSGRENFFVLCCSYFECH